MDKYSIDGQKLMYHVERLNGWLSGKTIYPVYIEASPIGACNHRCIYCGLDFMGYKPDSYDTPLFKERLTEMGELGLKSIMYAGEGEPFLHKDIAEIITHTKDSGIDAAVTTNGVLLSEVLADEILGSVEWIKVSINGATEKTYSKIHRSKPGDLGKVIKNMTYAARSRKKNKYKCVLGMQLLLLPENHKEAVMLGRIAKDIGMDYLVIKPYSQHPQSETTKYKDIKYGKYEYLREGLTKLNDENFNIVFRTNAMKKWDASKREYKCCQALPFWSYIDSKGNVWGCSIYLRDERFLYGNIFKSSFKEVWEGKKRARSLKWAEKGLDVSHCRINCRMDEINKYLWRIKHPPEHVNFI